MSYQYEAEKENIFTESGQKDFLAVRDTVKRLLKDAGAFTMESAIKGICGSSWTSMAYVDRLVELNEIVEITRSGGCAGQYRVFTAH